jgi:hypothetical protein
MKTPTPKLVYSLLDEIRASTRMPLSEERRSYQVGEMRRGLEELRMAPHPRRYAWHCCSDALNLLETLIGMGEVADEDGLLTDALTALADAAKRHLDGKSLRMTGPGLQAVEYMLEDYAKVIEVLPARTVIRAHRLTEMRIYAIRANKAQAHDVRIVAL